MDACRTALADGGDSLWMAQGTGHLVDYGGEIMGMVVAAGLNLKMVVQFTPTTAQSDHASVWYAAQEH